MFSATWVTSSSSKQYLTSGLIASRTFASGPLPSATPRIAMSRSVIMPTSLSFSVTGNRPASIFFIKAAALRIVSSCLISCTSLLMTLLIFIACPPLFIYPHHITLGPGILFMTLQVDEPRPGFQRGRGLGNTPSSASKLFLVLRAPLVKCVGGIDVPAGTRARRTSPLLDAINGETLKQLRTSIMKDWPMNGLERN